MLVQSEDLFGVSVFASERKNTVSLKFFWVAVIRFLSTRLLMHKFFFASSLSLTFVFFSPLRKVDFVAKSININSWDLLHSEVYLDFQM